MADAQKDPKTITVYGRLSYPVFSYAEAVTRNQKSKFAKPDVTTVTPEFNLLLEQPQLDKIMTHVTTLFLPWVEQQGAADAKGGLEKAMVDKLRKVLAAGDWDTQPPYLPFKLVPEATAKLAPEAVVMLKVMGNRGVDIEQKAIVNTEDELIVPDPDLLKYPVLKPIGQTVHQLYAGCYAAATLNLYAYMSGKLPGFSASAGVVVFKADADRFGGGVAVDEDEIFAD